MMMLKMKSKTSASQLTKISLASFSKKKLNPAAGFKFQKLEEGEQMVGFRPYGNTDIFKQTKNYNFELQRSINENRKNKLVIGMVLLSLVPFFVFVKNAEQNFRKAEVKQITSKRRQRLDKEHGVDREKMRDDFTELDKMFRISEKEEIEKFKQLGKNAEEYYKHKEQQQNNTFNQQDQQQEQPSSSQDESSEIVESKTTDGMQVQHVVGDTYEQVKVQQVGNTPDPRVAGPKIIFDSRLDKFQTTQQSKEYIKQKQQESPPYTAEDKKQLLINMLSKKNPVPESDKKEAQVPPQEQQQTQEALQEEHQKSTGFQRSSKKSGFKNDAEAEPLYQPFNEHLQSEKEKLLYEVAEKYNIIVKFLKRYDKNTRDFFSYLLIKTIPQLSGIDQDEIESLLNFLEKEHEDTNIPNHYFGNETFIKLKLAKPTIDIMLEQSLSITKVIDVQGSIGLGLEAQAREFKKAVSEYKRLQYHLKTLNEYQQGIKELKHYGMDTAELDLEKLRVQSFVSNIFTQLQKLESVLNTGTIELINKDKSTTKPLTLEQQIYTEKYQAMKNEIFANENYKTAELNKDNEFTPKVKEIEEKLQETIQNESFNKGILKFFKNELQQHLLKGYVQGFSEELKHREIYESKIKSDLSIIMTDYKDIFRKIYKCIEGEVVFQNLNTLMKDSARHGFTLDDDTTATESQEEQDFVFDKTNLLYEIVQKGAPDSEELEQEIMQFRKSLKSLSFVDRLKCYAQGFGVKSEPEEDKQDQSVLYALKISRAGRLQDAYHIIKRLKLKDTVLAEQQKRLIFKMESRLLAEQIYKHEIKLNDEEFTKMLKQI